jgi:serine/threonine-protein kinase
MSAPNATYPDQLLHYQLGQCLGEGGFGQVFEAWDSKLHRKVAVKILKNSATGIDLLKEARLAASLQHAAFVKIHALEQTAESRAIVMELVSGRTLRQMLESQSLDQTQVLDMVCQIAQAMQEAHAAGLTHGDLKPSNLMQEPGGAVRILDFGLATQNDSEATASLVQTDPQGTIAYMAPEILTGASLRPAADIYALGVILYELLTGSRPFANLTGLALAAALIQSNSDHWPWPDTLPSSLRQLVRAMTARQLPQRLGSMQEVATQCAQLFAPDLPGLTAPIHPASFKPGAAPARLWSRARKPWGRGLFILLSVFALFGLWYSQPYWSQLSAKHEPWSESQEMKLGLAALDYFDRHEMLDVAERHFKKILAHAPENAAAVASLSLVHSYRYAADGQNELALQKAEAAAQQALKLNDLLALSHIAHAKVLALRDMPAPALLDLERALALDPNSHLLLCLKVEVLIRSRRLEEALQLAKQGMQHFPQERLYADLTGQIHMLMLANKAAEDDYRLSIRLKPDAVTGYIGLANALFRQDRFDEGVQALQTGLKVRPGSELYVALGTTLFARGDYVGAAAAFESAVAPGSGNPDDYLAWESLAETLSWIPGRTDAVRKAWDKARELLTPRLQQFPANPELLSRLGLYAAKVEDRADALTKVQKAQSLAPDNPAIQFRAGVSYEMVGDRTSALAAIVKARQLGYPGKKIEAEPELIALRRDPNYLKQ